MWKIMAIAGAVFWAGVASAGQDAMIDRLKADFAKGELEHLHSVHIHVGDEVFAQAYFPGTDEAWGQPLGVVEHGPDTLHDLRSVTKSIVSLLYGIALSEGSVPALDTPVVDAFPEYPDLAADPARRAITVAHVLTMQMGTWWDESLPYTDPRNSEIAMELSDDRLYFALSQDIVEPPGQTWTYNGGATALIGAMISRGTGMDLADYGKSRLFEPLGIEAFEWARGRDGAPSAASGLRLRAGDLSKIGRMVMAGGTWQGQQLVPKSWLDAALTPHADTGGLRYGFFWWLAPGEGPPAWYAGFGNGGQRLSIAPQLGSVVVIFAGRYNDWSAWELPVKVIMEYFAPALEARQAAEP